MRDNDSNRKRTRNGSDRNFSRALPVGEDVRSLTSTPPSKSETPHVVSWIFERPTGFRTLAILVAGPLRSSCLQNPADRKRIVPWFRNEIQLAGLRSTLMTW